jgi:hypothetical protein
MNLPNGGGLRLGVVVADESLPRYMTHTIVYDFGIGVGFERTVLYIPVFHDGFWPELVD